MSANGFIHSDQLAHVIYIEEETISSHNVTVTVEKRIPQTVLTMWQEICVKLEEVMQLLKEFSKVMH